MGAPYIATSLRIAEYMPTAFVGQTVGIDQHDSRNLRDLSGFFVCDLDDFRIDVLDVDLLVHKVLHLVVRIVRGVEDDCLRFRINRVNRTNGLQCFASHEFGNVVFPNAGFDDFALDV